MLTSENITLITAIAGLAFGSVGAVLGVINTWRSIARDRIKIKVTPIMIIYPEAEYEMGIQIINLSFIPVTISRAGFTVQGSDDHIPTTDGTVDRKLLPQRMEPRTMITLRINPAISNHPNFAKVHKAYIETACGRVFKGTSDALRGQVKKVAAKIKQ